LISKFEKKKNYKIKIGIGTQKSAFKLKPNAKPNLAPKT
jgi:hypothetical protein